MLTLLPPWAPHIRTMYRPPGHSLVEKIAALGSLMSVVLLVPSAEILIRLVMSLMYSSPLLAHQKLAGFLIWEGVSVEGFPLNPVAGRICRVWVVFCWIAANVFPSDESVIAWYVFVSLVVGWNSPLGLETKPI